MAAGLSASLLIYASSPVATSGPALVKADTQPPGQNKVTITVKGDKRVIAHTKLLGGGESDAVTFPVASLKAGEAYTYFCSFPGHSALMKGTLALAKYPNVSVKLSSVANHSHEDYPYRDINVHVRRVFDAYGPQRCHWGSDMTRALARATYRQRVTHFTEALDFLSEDDKDLVMGRSLLKRLR